MDLKKQIADDLKQAMKSGDNARRDTLRMIDTAIKNTEIEKKKKAEGLSDDEIQEVIGRYIKQRKDSIVQYEAGGRADLVENEQAEIKTLEKYLPAQLNEDELSAIVKKTIEELGAGPADIGKVMGAVMAKVKGKADGSAVKKTVDENLGKR